MPSNRVPLESKILTQINKIYICVYYKFILYTHACILYIRVCMYIYILYIKKYMHALYIHTHTCMYIYFFTYVFASSFVEHKYYILIYNKSDCLYTVSCIGLTLTFEDLFLFTIFYGLVY